MNLIEENNIIETAIERDKMEMLGNSEQTESAPPCN
jgi:hypothetical protein